jgi:hypothetical protein
MKKNFFIYSIYFFLFSSLFFKFFLCQRQNNEYYGNDYRKRGKDYEKYETQVDEFASRNKDLELACLDKSYLKKNKDGKVNLINSSNKEKTESFKNGKCPPVILVPGYGGSKLDFKITNCNLFSKSHPEILKTCKWDNCHSQELKKFSVWINTDIDIGEIMSRIMGGGQPPNKKKKKMHIPKILRSIVIEDTEPIEYEMNEGCLGSLLRLYYKEINEENDNKVYNIEKLEGAEISVQATTREKCGADITSNILGDIFSISNTYKGFLGLNDHLTKQGYFKGLSLFNVPYDFRQDIDKLMIEVNKAIRTAYEINKKKVLIIGHSYGGLISLKLSTTQKEKDLIQHVITIGSPFLGTSNGGINQLSQYEKFEYEKEVNYMGISGKIKTKLDDTSSMLMFASYPSLVFFPKQMLNDETDESLKTIGQLETLLRNYYKTNKEYNDETKNLYNNFIENSNKKSILNKFYNIFPKPYKFCTSIPQRNKFDEFGICKINLKESTNKTLFKYNDEEIHIKDPLDEKNHEEYMSVLNKFYEKNIKKMNELTSEKYKLSPEKYLKHLIKSQEKELFEKFERNKDIEYSFVYGNHLKTLEYAEFNEINGKILRKNEEYGHGDFTINGFSQIYPGLRWVIQDISNEEISRSSKINFIEYCALRKSDKNKYDKTKSHQHISLKCDCMTSPNLDPLENCNHSGMVNDKNLINFVSELLNNSESKIYKSSNFEDLFSKQFNDKMKCGNLFN